MIAQLLIDFINILFGPVQNFGIDSNVQFGIYDEENCYVVLSDHIPDDSSFTVSHFSLNLIGNACFKIYRNGNDGADTQGTL